MKRYAIFDALARQWLITLAIHINRKAENAGQQCIENAIFAINTRPRRMKKLTQLFQSVLIFRKFDTSMTWSHSTL